MFTRKTRKTILIGLALLSFAAAKVYAAEEGAMNMQLQSSAFKNNEGIPKQYTCEDKNISPPLSWSGIPGSTKSLALIVDDPDAPDPAAPQKTFVHWVLFNIPPNVQSLAENATTSGSMQTGMNDYAHMTYDGPCPPIGKHRYMFKFYALDTMLKLEGAPTKAQLEAAMKNHILGQTLLVGLYQKGQ